MGRAGVSFWLVVGIIGFIALMLCGLGLGSAAIIFMVGAPHAIPRSSAVAASFFLLALVCVVLAVVLLRRSIRAFSANWQSGSQKQVRKSLYALAAAALLIVVGAIIFPWVYEPWWPASGSVQHGDYMVEPILRSACS